MKELLKQVIEVLENRNYSIQAEYCFPERVTEIALTHAEDTAESRMASISNEEVEEYVVDSIAELGDETNVVRVLKDIANDLADYSGYETITCCVVLD
jgi:translation elongation factor EF-Ts